MGVHKKLKAWQEAGLVTAGQAQAITAYEQTHKRGRFSKGLIAVALFAILCGVLSIIGANWADIPGSLKISAHVFLNFVIAVALWKNFYPRFREGFCLLLFGLTLTLIVLIGQVFQIGGSWAGALMLWMIITAPMMAFFSETRITAIPWIIAFLGSVGVILQEYLQPLPEFWGALFITATVLFLPLALIADGNIRFIARHRPVYAQIFIGSGFAALLCFATGASLLWYVSRAHGFESMARSIEQSSFNAQLSICAIFILCFIAQAAYAALRKFYANEPEQKAGALIAALCTVSMGLPVLITGEGGGLISALHFIALWMAIGAIAQEQGWHRLVSFAIVMIAVRIFAIYCELFGSLMDTGIGLVLGGLIILGLMWGSRRLNRHLKRGGADASV